VPRQGKPLQVYLADDLREDLEAFVAGIRPKTSLSAVAVEAIEEYLRTRGKRQPASAEPEPGPSPPPPAPSRAKGKARGAKKPRGKKGS
jgi:hypothetical protein